MISSMELQLHRLHGIFFVVCFAQISLLYHLLKNDITALTTTFRITDRIEVRRVLTKSDKRGGLSHSEIFRFLTEIDIRSGLNTNRIMKKVKIIQIHCNNLVFRIITFELYSDHPLNRFLQHAFQGCAGMFRIELLSQLLGDSRTTTSTLLSKQATLDDSTSKRDKVNT